MSELQRMRDLMSGNKEQIDRAMAESKQAGGEGDFFRMMMWMCALMVLVLFLVIVK